ncbi:MAG TPA: Hpt domain-containing protein, partial [Ramlibacter sp.]|nr:Hpt domain-containing protein [Ramlibacter sp.]
VSDRQTMGSVVSELRGTLAELEKLLDQYFRNLQDKAPLRDAPGHLSQMRGVLSVLGLDQAAQAVLRMREAVEEIIVTEIDEEQVRAAGTFDKLGNNLGALGFLIDMLNYQPSLAKKLFVYDDSTGELRPLMGRNATATEIPEQPADHLSQQVMSVVNEAAESGFGELSDKLGSIEAHATLADNKGVASAAREVAAAMTAQDTDAAAAALSNLAAAVSVPPAAAPVAEPEPDIEEDDLLDIFLEEAREVVQNGLAALDTLAVSPTDAGEMTTLRRAFHTLKGSSRMVGLTEFGEAAWSLEQVLNTWLADQKPATDELRVLAKEAMRGFGRWTEDIAAHNDSAWKAAIFRGPADALRMENKLVALSLPEAAPAPVVIEAVEPPSEAPVIEMPADEPVMETAPAVEPAPEEPVPSFEFSIEPAADEPAVEIAETIDAAPPVDIVETIEAPVTAAADPFDFGATQVIRGEPPEAAEIPAGELPADFDFEPSPTIVLRPEPASAEQVAEIDGIDFASLSAVSGAGQQDVDDQVKVIGTLRIGIPLYNVYLNEADEWSRRLATEVAEWSLELNHQVPDSTVGLAHALAGSSATVGFHALSDIARALESALQHTQSLAFGTPQHGQAFIDAAEEIRRLLHQFAAGFLKDPAPGVLDALLALKDLDIPLRDELPDEESVVSAFGDLDFAAAAPEQEPPAAMPEPVELAAVEPVAIEPEPVAIEPEPIAIEPIAYRTPEPQPERPAAPVFEPAPVIAADQRRTVQAFNDDDSDDIDVIDAIDPDLFPIFEEEAVELMPQLGGALRQWSARPDNRSARDEVLRALHTLKGSARLAGALRLGELAHRMESEIESLGSTDVAVGDIEPLLQRYDSMQANFDSLRATGGMPVAVPEAIAPQVPVIDSVVPPTDAAAARSLIARPATTNLAPQRASANQAVRVRSQLLDRLVNQAGEVMITRSRLEAELRQLRGSLTDLTGNLDRLRAQLRDIELQAESQMQSRLAQAKDSAAGFDPLEFDRFTRVQELTRMMAESVNDVATVQRNLQRTVESTEDDLIAQARQTRELQRDLLRTRMVEFEGISDRLYRVIRLASKETGKQVKLDIT